MFYHIDQICLNDRSKQTFTIIALALLNLKSENLQKSKEPKYWQLSYTIRFFQFWKKSFHHHEGCSIQGQNCNESNTSIKAVSALLVHTQGL